MENLNLDPKKPSECTSTSASPSILAVFCYIQPEFSLEFVVSTETRNDSSTT